MNMASHNIKIQHETFGVLLNETFVNQTQFKLFLKMVQGCIELKNDLTFSMVLISLFISHTNTW
jgi:hypothetical protein